MLFRFSLFKNKIQQLQSSLQDALSSSSNSDSSNNDEAIENEKHQQLVSLMETMKSDYSKKEIQYNEEISQLKQQLSEKENEFQQVLSSLSSFPCFYLPSVV
jgi:predicted RNase H-like nuclease (RuvC/YqgF family)